MVERIADCDKMTAETRTHRSLAIVGDVVKYINHAYLLMAAFWAALAYFFYTHPRNPKETGFEDFRVLIAIMLSVYLVIRWWGRQVLSQSRQPPEEKSDWKRPPARRSSDEREPNPEFQFDESKPEDQEGNPGITDKGEQ